VAAIENQLTSLVKSKSVINPRNKFIRTNQLNQRFSAFYFFLFKHISTPSAFYFFSYFFLIQQNKRNFEAKTRSA